MRGDLESSRSPARTRARESGAEGSEPDDEDCHPVVSRLGWWCVSARLVLSKLQHSSLAYVGADNVYDGLVLFTLFNGLVTWEDT